MRFFKARRGWRLDPSCPCDVHFVEYFNGEGLDDQVVFHLGSGEHHLVGKELCKPGTRNEVLALTLSEHEYDAYVDAAKRDAEFGARYKLLFADIHTLTERILPEFDLITLFHLGEWVDADNRDVWFVKDLDMVKMLVGRLRPGGRVLFYRDSSGKEPAQAIISVLEKLGRIRSAGEFKSLRIYEASGS